MTASARRRPSRITAARWLMSVGLMVALVGGLAGRASAGGADDAITVSGGHGPGPAANQLTSPSGVAVDGHGDVFVADTGKDRVQEWTPGATQGITVAGGHGWGPASNQLASPCGVAVDGHGNIFVADTDNMRVQEWTPGATQGITVAGSEDGGSGANQLTLPRGVAVDGHGNIFVGDWYNARVQEWTPGAAQGRTVAAVHLTPTGVFNYGQGVAVDGHDDVFVADTANMRVQEWTPGATQGITVAGETRFHGGSAADQLSSPVGVAVDEHNDVFVADTGNQRVQEWTPGATQGITVAGGNGQGNAADQLNLPQGGSFTSSAAGIAVNGRGQVLVADSLNDRVQEITLPPRLIPVEQATTTLTYYTTTSDDAAPAVHAGNEMVLVATVIPATGTSPAHGTVDFSDGAADLGAVPLYSNKATSYAILYITATTGTHNLVGQYSGDTTYTSDTSTPIHISVTG